MLSSGRSDDIHVCECVKSEKEAISCNYVIVYCTERADSISKGFISEITIIISSNKHTTPTFQTIKTQDRSRDLITKGFVAQK